nr:choline transport protein [Quercus suber]
MHAVTFGETRAALQSSLMQAISCFAMLCDITSRECNGCHGSGLSQCRRAEYQTCNTMVFAARPTEMFAMEPPFTHRHCATAQFTVVTTGTVKARSQNFELTSASLAISITQLGLHRWDLYTKTKIMSKPELYGTISPLGSPDSTSMCREATCTKENMPPRSPDTASGGSADGMLETMGYTSKLTRSRSTLGVAFMSFVLASVPYGLSTTLIYPLTGGGPVTIIWGWLLVCLLMLCVAISLGEITSVRPMLANGSTSLSDAKANTILGISSGRRCILPDLHAFSEAHPFSHGLVDWLVLLSWQCDYNSER